MGEFLGKHEKGKLSFKSLWSGYTMYGEDPFIVCDDKGCKF